MARVGLRKRLRYRFDNFMARGTAAQIIGLTVVTFSLMFVFAALIWGLQLSAKSSGGGQSLWDSFWGLLRPATPSWNTNEPGYMVVKAAMLIAGMFVASLLISILTSGFRNMVQDLREGRSEVPVSGHTLILGWSPALHSILPELILANESERRAHVVILSTQTKQKMDDELARLITERKTTEIVTRSGDPYGANDLTMVNIAGARSVIVLAPEASKTPDIDVIKTLMAVANNAPGGSGHIVAAIRDPKNISVAKLAGKGTVEVIPAIETISKLTAQTCRQPGLPIVYTEIMQFEDNELYLTAAAQPGGTFADELFAYRHCCPIGVWTKADELLLNPRADYRLSAGDRLVVLAEDDSAIVRTGAPYRIDEVAISDSGPSALPAKRAVVIGWNAGAPIIARELEEYMSAGSELVVLVPNEATQKKAQAVAETLTKLRFSCSVGEATDRAVLDELNIADANHIILLKYDELEANQSDSIVLVTLLHLRDIIETSGRDISVVSELALDRNRQIAHADRADDFVVGDYIVGLLCAQISQQRELNRVFGELLSQTGAEIYLKPAESYVKPGVEVSFYTVVEAARRRGEVAIGYRVWAEKGDPARRYGVNLNPDKQQRFTFAPGDRVVVVASDYAA